MRHRHQKTTCRTRCLKQERLIIAFLVFGALAWASGEPWRSKPYQKWTDEDINSIFSDSPWSQALTVERTWVPWVNKELPEAPIGPGGKSAPTALEQSTPVARGSRARFYVSWMSARVMRKALVRYAIIHSGQSTAGNEETLEREPSEYFIMVQGTDMTPFQDHDEQYYQQNAFLRTKVTKRKVLPNRVTYEMKSDGKSVNAANFFFS